MSRSCHTIRAGARRSEARRGGGARMRTLRLLAVPLLLALVGPALATGALAAPAAHGVECAIDPFPEDTVEIMAPAAPGGGWDTTAREMQVVLQDHVLEGDGVEVVNVEGAGGTVG